MDYLPRTGLREFFLLLLLSPSLSLYFRTSSCPLPSSKEALPTSFSDTSELFFHPFQHSVDNIQHLCLLEFCFQQKMQTQLINITSLLLKQCHHALKSFQTIPL